MKGIIMINTVLESNKSRASVQLCICAIALVSATSTAFAHSENGIAIDFAGGFAHPITGFDHLVAMVAVGLWGAFLGMPAIWILPVVFPLVMAFGGALGVLGMPLPGVETGIALSAIALGAMVALAAKPPIWIAAVLVGAFAIFHGHAHGTELPLGSAPLLFASGFVIATALLHGAGIALGLGMERLAATSRIWTARAAGGLMSLFGVSLLAQ